MKMYEELAEEKAEKENRELRRQPRERDHAGEQRKKVERVRQREEEGKILQCNEGKWEFHFDEESVKGSIILDLHVSRHLDSSLIDLDIHPAYVSVVIKSKVLRLKLPSEVNASLSTAKRSKVRAVWKSSSELGYLSLHAIEPTWSRGQRRVDGVRVDGMGRPKFDFRHRSRATYSSKCPK